MVNLDVQYPCTLQLNDDGVSFSMERVFFLGLPLGFHIAEQHVVVVTEQFAEHVAVGSLAAQLELEFAESQVLIAET